MLCQFVIQVVELYGPINMKFNVHLLTHLAKYVKIWGPMWAFSAFPYESMNGTLKTLVKGTISVAPQIICKFMWMQAIPYFGNKYQISPNMVDVCETFFCKQPSFGTKLLHGFQFGEGMARAGIRSCDYLNLYDRSIVKAFLVTASSYACPKLTNDCVIEMDDGSVAEITALTNLTEFENNVAYAFVNVFQCICPGIKMETF